MPLEPQTQAFLEQLAAANPPRTETLSVEQHRLSSEQARLARPANPEPVARVVDRTIPGPHGEIPVRIYWPSERRPLPGLVYFHGGGWVIGSLDGTDLNCRSFANRGECIVVSVDYRLAPEHKFPIPLEDCYTATVWTAAHAAELGLDPTRLAVGGASAGGNLAAAVALLAKERGGPPLVYQLLIYPVTDYALDTPSARDNAEGYMLTTSAMRWYWNHYLRSPEDGQNPYASPLRATDLRGLPRAHIVTAEYDPLRDEGEAYGQRLQAAGVPVEIDRYLGVIHGFVSMANIFDVGAQAVDAIGAKLRAALHTAATTPGRHAT